MSAAESAAVAEARARVSAARDEPAWALAQLRLAAILGREADHAGAAGCAAHAADVFERISDGWGRAHALRLRGDLLTGLGRHDEALAVLVTAAGALAVSDLSGGWSSGRAGGAAAGCEAAIARCLRMLGRLEEADAHLAKAASGYGIVGMQARHATCLLDRAVILHARKDLDGAIGLLGTARLMFLRCRRADATAVCDFNLGVALYDHGRLDDAVEALHSARIIFESLDRDDDVAGCNQNLGVALHAMGRHGEAGQRLRAARATFALLGRDRDVAQCDHNLAVVFQALGHDRRPDRIDAQVESEHTAGAVGS